MPAEGLAVVESSLRKAAPGPYTVQAAIAAVHARAERAADTDWPQIVAARGDLSRRLERWAKAAEAYRQALSLVSNDAERRFLARRPDGVEGKGQ